MKFKILLVVCSLVLLLTGCQANCVVHEHSDDEYNKLKFEYSDLEKNITILENENRSLKNNIDACEKKYLDALAKDEYVLGEHLTDMYTYEKEGQVYYVSACYGVKFHLGKELPENFLVKDNREDGYFGIFFKNQDIIEPIYVFTVIPKDNIQTGEEMMPRKIFYEYDNGLCVIDSLVGFNGSSIDFSVWNNIINPFIETLDIYFEE